MDQNNEDGNRMSKIIWWAMKYSGGLVKDEKQARYVILGFALAAVVFIVVLFNFVLYNYKTFPLRTEEEKLFRGKSSSEKSLLPQKIDENLFTQ